MNEDLQKKMDEEDKALREDIEKMKECGISDEFAEWLYDHRKIGWKDLGEK